MMVLRFYQISFWFFIRYRVTGRYRYRYLCLLSISAIYFIMYRYRNRNIYMLDNFALNVKSTNIQQCSESVSEFGGKSTDMGIRNWIQIQQNYTDLLLPDTPHWKILYSYKTLLWILKHVLLNFTLKAAENRLRYLAHSIVYSTINNSTMIKGFQSPLSWQHH